MDNYMGFIEGLMIRLSGPMSFRFIIQPLMATIFACRDGMKDAREGKPPYFWGLFTDAANRSEMLKSGWKSVGKIFIIAIILDNVFQYIVFHNLSRPGGALIAAVILALLPYITLRGPVNRLFRRIIKERKS